MQYKRTISKNSIFDSDEDINLIPVSKKPLNFRSFRPVVFCILIFELCERLTFYSISANFVKFCTIYLGVGNIAAVNFSLLFTGGIYIISLFCGWISDSVLGKYRTIIFSGPIYAMGVALVTLVTYEFSPEYDLTLTQRRIFTGFGLVLITFGTGCIKTTVGPFGADQLEKNNENLTKLFFIWFYWFVNIGSGIAFVTVTYVQQNINFFYGFLIPLCSIGLAILIFMISKKYYVVNHQIAGNTIFTFVKIILEARRKKSTSIYKQERFLDYARSANQGSYDDKTINELRKVIQIIPVLLTFIPFYISYVQMQSTYLLQAERLNLKLYSIEIPVASLNVVNTLVIILVVPILAVVVYPAIHKIFGKSPTHLQRIGFGLFLSALSVFMAGVLEILRKQDLNKNGGIYQKVFENTYNVSSISVLSQIPQFFFVGVGEVFASATGLEFAYSQAPLSMHGVVTGLFYVSIGIGSFASSLLILIVNINQKSQWMPNDIDQGHYEYFFFLLGAIILLDVIIFIVIAKFYKYDLSNSSKDFIIKYQKNELNEEDNVDIR